MDVSNSTDTPSDGRPPIEAVAATAAEYPPEDASNDRASGSTVAWRREEQHIAETEKHESVQDKGVGENDIKESDGINAAAPMKEKSGAPHSRSALSDLHGSGDSSQFKGKLREKWWQVYRPKYPPPPPPESLDDAKILPLAQVSFLNELLYIWIAPLIKLGKRRPLQVSQVKKTM